MQPTIQIKIDKPKHVISKIMTIKIKLGGYETFMISTHQRILSFRKYIDKKI